MVHLYGESFTRDSLRARVGHESQIGGVQRLVMDEGNTRGTEVVEFITGSGLVFHALPTRGLDIGLAQFQGKAIGWRSRTGEVQPAYLGDEGFQARRGSFGGLMCTCGYSQVGVPNMDQGAQFGLHGRAQLCPAKALWTDADWEGDEYRMWCKGKIVELDKFGEYFENSRSISTSLGSNTIRVEDSIRNLAFSSQPHMILYHINLGWPLVSGHTRLYAPSLSRRHRDKDSYDFDWTRYHVAPQPQAEDVLYHQMEASPDGLVHLALINETPGKERWGLELAYSYATLPRLVNWRQPSPGAYVVGLEPSNCWADGRAAHRQRGDLVIMEPGETKNYLVEFTILGCEQDVSEALSRINAKDI